MLSSLSSALAKLDDSLQTIQTQTERLREGLDPNVDQLHRRLAESHHYASLLIELMNDETFSANVGDPRILDQVIQELKTLRRTHRCRLKFLDLAAELDAGRVQHHRVSRSQALNEMRLAAVKELLGVAADPAQQKQLPGPAPSKWMHWACALQEETDAASLETLRRDFPAVESFIADMHLRYWLSGHGGDAEFSLAEGDEAPDDAREEPLPAGARKQMGATPVDHDRLARDLIATFQKSLREQQLEGSSRASQKPPLQTPSSPEIQVASKGHPLPGRTAAEAPEVAKGEAPTTARWLGLKRSSGTRFMYAPGRGEKERLDRAAAGSEFIKVVKAWRLDDAQARRLLDISRTELHHLQKGKRLELEPDKLTRISLLVAIAKGLNVLYGSRRGEKWVHRPNTSPPFEGTEPLKYMLKGGVDGLLKVRDLVGVWSAYVIPQDRH